MNTCACHFFVVASASQSEFLPNAGLFTASVTLLLFIANKITEWITKRKRLKAVKHFLYTELASVSTKVTFIDHMLKDLLSELNKDFIVENIQSSLKNTFQVLRADGSKTLAPLNEICTNLSSYLFDIANLDLSLFDRVSRVVSLIELYNSQIGMLCSALLSMNRGLTLNEEVIPSIDRLKAEILSLLISLQTELWPKSAANVEGLFETPNDIPL